MEIIGRCIFRCICRRAKTHPNKSPLFPLQFTIDSGRRLAYTIEKGIYGRRRSTCRLVWKGAKNISMRKDKLIKPLLVIAAVIVFSSVFVRIFSGSETLAEYAAESPETPPPKTGDGTGTAEKTGQDTAAPAMPETAVPSSGMPPAEQGQTAGNSMEQEDILTGDETNRPAQKNITADMADSTKQESGDSSMKANPERVVYKEGFYYEPVSEELKRRITGISYPVTETEKGETAVEAVNIVASAAEIQVSYDDLCYLSVLHYNFQGVERTGELICNKAIAQDLAEIFYELYRNEYQIEQIRLIDEYSGDDTLSMQDNNTSCFNYRVVDGTSSLSKHALGLAIDINPFFNPYVVFKPDGTAYISPQGSETYADRSKSFAYKIDENDLCYRLFKEHGFIWGGNWNSCKDYQHFQKTLE